MPVAAKDGKINTLTQLQSEIEIVDFDQDGDVGIPFDPLSENFDDSEFFIDDFLPGEICCLSYTNPVKTSGGGVDVDTVIQFGEFHDIVRQGV